MQGTDLQEHHASDLAAHLAKMTGLEHLGLPRVHTAESQRLSTPSPTVKLLNMLHKECAALKIVVATGIQAADLRKPDSHTTIAHFVQAHPDLQELHIRDSSWSQSMRDRQGEEMGEAVAAVAGSTLNAAENLCESTLKCLGCGGCAFSSPRCC